MSNSRRAKSAMRARLTMPEESDALDIPMPDITTRSAALPGSLVMRQTYPDGSERIVATGRRDVARALRARRTWCELHGGTLTASAGAHWTCTVADGRTIRYQLDIATEDD